MQIIITLVALCTTTGSILPVDAAAVARPININFRNTESSELPLPPGRDFIGTDYGSNNAVMKQFLEGSRTIASSHQQIYLERDIIEKRFQLPLVHELMSSIRFGGAEQQTNLGARSSGIGIGTHSNAYPQRVKRSNKDKSDTIKSEHNDAKDAENLPRSNSEADKDDEEDFGSEEGQRLDGLPGRG